MLFTMLAKSGSQNILRARSSGNVKAISRIQNPDLSGLQRHAALRAWHDERRCSTIAHAKKDIHPKYYEEAKYTVDIWSGNHPFYTKSETTLVQEEGRVSRFNKRFAGMQIGEVGTSKPGEKKLDYKAAAKQKAKKGKGKR